MWITSTCDSTPTVDRFPVKKAIVIVEHISAYFTSYTCHTVLIMVKYLLYRIVALTWCAISSIYTHSLFLADLSDIAIMLSFTSVILPVCVSITMVSLRIVDSFTILLCISGALLFIDAF